MPSSHTPGQAGSPCSASTQFSPDQRSASIVPTPEAGPLSRDAESTLWQGYLESSTVEPVMEMAGIVEIGRAVEANAKLMQAQDLLAGQAINTFGKVT